MIFFVSGMLRLETEQNSLFKMSSAEIPLATYKHTNLKQQMNNETFKNEDEVSSFKSSTANRNKSTRQESNVEYKRTIV